MTMPVRVMIQQQKPIDSSTLPQWAVMPTLVLLVAILGVSLYFFVQTVRDDFFN